MDVYGLTGGIGSGKSAVASLLEEYGVPVVSADELSRVVVARGSQGLSDVVTKFGPDVVDETGELDRRRMAGIVFRDPDKRRELEAILHPRIRERFEQVLDALEKAGHEVAVYEVPLLFEKNLQGEMKAVVLVTAPAASRITRVCERDDVTEPEVRARISAQMDEALKRRKADYVIENDGSLDDLRREVEFLLMRFLRITGPARRGAGDGLRNTEVPIAAPDGAGSVEGGSLPAAPLATEMPFGPMGPKTEVAGMTSAPPRVPPELATTRPLEDTPGAPAVVGPSGNDTPPSGTPTLAPNEPSQPVPVGPVGAPIGAGAGAATSRAASDASAAASSPGVGSRRTIPATSSPRPPSPGAAPGPTGVAGAMRPGQPGADPSASSSMKTVIPTRPKGPPRPGQTSPATAAPTASNQPPAPPGTPARGQTMVPPSGSASPSPGQPPPPGPIPGTPPPGASGPGHGVPAPRGPTGTVAPPPGATPPGAAPVPHASTGTQIAPAPAYDPSKTEIAPATRAGAPPSAPPGAPPPQATTRDLGSDAHPSRRPRDSRPPVEVPMPGAAGRGATPPEPATPSAVPRGGTVRVQALENTPIANDDGEDEPPKPPAAGSVPGPRKKPR